MLWPKKVKELQFSDDNNLNLLLEGNTILNVDFAFGVIRRKPNNMLLEENTKELFESIIFGIGDLVNDNYRQMSIAAGEGMLCTMKIINLITNEIY